MSIDYAAFIEGLDAELAEFERAARVDQRELADDIVDRAQANVAVRSGVLEASLGVEEGADQDGPYLDVGVVKHPSVPAGHAQPEEYALAEELGHVTPTGHHVPAHPFFRPAISSAESARTGPVL